MFDGFFQRMQTVPIFLSPDLVLVNPSTAFSPANKFSTFNLSIKNSRLVMSSPPHPLFHFGMAGWFEIRHEDTFYHKSTKPKDLSWPPEYWKFTFETAEEPKCEAAFVDFRRLARIRLIDCAAEDIRHVSPLKENGPDPVIDREVLTEQWLSEKLASKKLHVKTFLLNQANISGIGNWVG